MSQDQDQGRDQGQDHGQDYSRHYAHWHPDTEAHVAEMDAFYPRLLAPVLRGLSPASRVLDVGCGSGLLLHALQARGWSRLRGVDSSRQQVALAQRRGLPCEWIAPDGLAGCAPPASFELVFMLDVLEHVAVEAQIPFLRAAAGLLVPGGRLVLSVPNASASFAGRQRWGDWEHRASFTEHSLAQVLHEAGFTAMRLHPHEYGRPLRFPWLHQAAFWTHGLRRLFRALRRLEAVAEFGRVGLHMPLSLNLLAECRKPAGPAP